MGSHPLPGRHQGYSWSIHSRPPSSPPPVLVRRRLPWPCLLPPGGCAPAHTPQDRAGGPSRTPPARPSAPQNAPSAGHRPVGAPAHALKLRPFASLLAANCATRHAPLPSRFHTVASVPTILNGGQTASGGTPGGYCAPWWVLPSERRCRSEGGRARAARPSPGPPAQAPGAAPFPLTRPAGRAPPARGAEVQGAPHQGVFASRAFPQPELPAVCDETLEWVPAALPAFRSHRHLMI
jgi:hypothetical protein